MTLTLPWNIAPTVGLSPSIKTFHTSVSRYTCVIYARFYRTRSHSLHGSSTFQHGELSRRINDQENGKRLRFFKKANSSFRRKINSFRILGGSLCQRRLKINAVEKQRERERERERGRERGRERERKN